MKRKKKAFAFREFWKQRTKHTNIHKHVFKICFETFYGGYFYLCRKFTVRLPERYNSVSFKRNGIWLTFPKLCNVGCMWAVFHHNNRNLVLSKLTDYHSPSIFLFLESLNLVDKNKEREKGHSRYDHFLS